MVKDELVYSREGIRYGNPRRFGFSPQELLLNDLLGRYYRPLHAVTNLPTAQKEKIATTVICTLNNLVESAQSAYNAGELQRRVRRAALAEECRRQLQLFETGQGVDMVRPGTVVETREDMHALSFLRQATILKRFYADGVDSKQLAKELGIDERYLIKTLLTGSTLRKGLGLDPIEDALLGEYGLTNDRSIQDLRRIIIGLDVADMTLAGFKFSNKIREIMGIAPLPERVRQNVVSLAEYRQRRR